MEAHAGKHLHRSKGEVKQQYQQQIKRHEGTSTRRTYKINGPVAQWKRHRPTESGIAGSSPAGVIFETTRPCYQINNTKYRPNTQRRACIQLRYNPAGYDTRLSPERPGFKSRWWNIWQPMMTIRLAGNWPTARTHCESYDCACGGCPARLRICRAQL